jgi:hypothetical protein
VWMGVDLLFLSLFLSSECNDVAVTVAVAVAVAVTIAIATTMFASVASLIFYLRRWRDIHLHLRRVYPRRASTCLADSRGGMFDASFETRPVAIAIARMPSVRPF